MYDLSSIVTLGGPLTFSGEALAALCTATGFRPTIEYRATMDEVWGAIRSETVDAIFITGETTRNGLLANAAKLLEEPSISVIGEVVVPYHCALLGKPGSSIGDIRRVTGHGSLTQCKAYLARELPGVPVEMHVANSTVAAREILAGDGSEAVVGTRSVGEALGLSVLAHDIDSGATGVWWLIGGRPASTSGNTAVVHIALDAVGTATFPHEMVPKGWSLRSILTQPNGTRLWAYDLVTVWTSTAGAEEWRHPAARVRGRFQSVQVH